MKIIDTRITDIKIIEPEVFNDERGFFYESFHQQKLEDILGRRINFVQDNHSYSQRGVLRGLHYQAAPKAQAKLIRVTQGEIFDVAVDIRESSPTYGQWVGTILSAENKRQLWIPEGFAHGFYVISDGAECLYKTSEFYSAIHERQLAWNSSEFNIPWPLLGPPLLSPKDKAAAD